MVPVNDILRAHVALRGDGGQAELARALNVSEASVHRWVTGKSIPEEWRAAAIARAVGSDEATILSAISLARKHRQQAGDEAGQSADNQIQQLLTAVNELTKQFLAVEGLIKEALIERRRSGPDEGHEGKRNSR